MVNFASLLDIDEECSQAPPTARAPASAIGATAEHKTDAIATTTAETESPSDTPTPFEALFGVTNAEMELHAVCHRQAMPTTTTKDAHLQR